MEFRLGDGFLEVLGCVHEMKTLFESMAAMDLKAWIGLSLLGNAAVFAASVGFCAWCGRRWRSRPVVPEAQPVTKSDCWLAASTVLLNSLVAVVGWLMWKAGWIRITHPPLWRTGVDVVVFLVVMDLGMYVSHRLAHHPWIYPWVHRTHHCHDSVNPLSLFVLNPFEVLGFGALMLVVLVVLPLSGAAVLVYLALNVLFGTLGHAGVEPFPESWSRRLGWREIGSSSFHASHHQSPGGNFGFYTQIWDRLFGTLNREASRPVRQTGP